MDKRNTDLCKTYDNIIITVNVHASLSDFHTYFDLLLENYSYCLFYDLIKKNINPWYNEKEYNYLSPEIMYHQTCSSMAIKHKCTSTAHIFFLSLCTL